ncbi:MAG: hypothetical protein AB7F89_17590, partial [Pirellulaceae bacterium]
MRAAESSASGHRIKLAVLGLLTVLLTGAFILWVFLVPPATPFLVMGVTAYSFPLPPNSFAQEDVERLQDTNRDNLLLLAPPPESSIRRSGFLDHLKSRLASATPGGPGKDVILIYLSAHGVVDGSGEACLLLSDAQAHDPTTWLRMRDVLDVFRVRPDVRKVLMLDATRLDDEWSMGVLYNGFTDQLAGLLDELKIANLYVLNASAAGQRSLIAPELGASLFGHFVSRGLQGEASPDNRRITLRELAEYVGAEVAKYAGDGEQRVIQLPVLLTQVPPEQDFAIAYSGGAVSPAATSQADRTQLASKWERIHDYWRRLQASIQDQHLLRQDPIRVSKIQQYLLRMERLLLAGKAYVGELTAMEDRVRVLFDTEGGGAGPVRVDAFSMPLHRQLTGAPAVDEQAASELTRWQAVGGRPPLKKDEPLPPALRYATAAEVAWRFLGGQTRLLRTHLRDALQLIDESQGRRGQKNQPLPDLVEILYLRMLDRYLDVPPNTADFSDVQRSGIRNSLVARALAEQAAAPGDERVHYWIQSLVNEGDVARRVAEDRLFCDVATSTTGSPAADTYRQAIGRAQQVAGFLELRDTVWNGLPHLAAWVLRAPDAQASRGLAVSTDQLLKDVELLAQSNQALAAMLDQSLVDGKFNVSTDIQMTADQVRQAWEELRNSYVGYCQELKDRSSRDKPTLREIASVLRVPSPLLDAEERGLLVDVFLAGAFDRPDLPGGKATLPSAARADGQDGIPAILRPYAQGTDRLHPALQLLDRSRFVLLLNRHERLEELKRAGESDVTWLARQGERVRATLVDVDAAAQDLEDDTKSRLKDALETAANIRAGSSEADRLLRAAAPLAPGDLRNAPGRLRDVDHHLQLLWHARRVMDDFWGPSPAKDADSSDYFAVVADRYLEAARQFDDTPTSLTYERQDLRDLLNARRTAAGGIQLVPEDVRTIGDAPTVTQLTRVVWHKDLSSPGMAALFFDVPRSSNNLELIPVTDEDARPWRRQPLPVGRSAEATTTQRIPASELAGGQAQRAMAANLLYRGHVVRRTFELRGPELILAQSVSPQVPPSAQVTVRGDAQRKAFITFIVDCSGSMQTRDVGNDTRMNAAKSALFEVLQRLPQDENYQVGLRAYAHRFRFKDGTLREVIDRNGLPAAALPGPDRDVEILAGIKPLTQTHLAEIRDKVRGLAPNGVTPLYYSIQRALIDDEDDFYLATKDDIQHVIVITDGLNQNYVNFTTAQDVLDTINNPASGAGNKVVDIVMFGAAALRAAPPPGVNVAQGLEEIRRIAERTGGKLFDANDPDQLVAAIEKALGQFKFSLTPLSQTQVKPSDMTDLGRWKTVGFPPEKPGKYRVRLHGVEGVPDQTVELLGGEAVELDYDRQGNRLIFTRFGTGQTRDAQEPLDPVSQERVRVMPILPVRSINRVEFQVAIQYVDPAKFTPRPEHIWAEITPLDSDGKPVRPADVFYDTQFVPLASVPVLTFTVHDWPENAPQASL